MAETSGGEPLYVPALSLPSPSRLRRGRGGARLAFVTDAALRYIERTHAWYGALGYPPYRYAQFDEVPFAPLGRPLAQARVALLTTAAPYRPELGEQGAGAAYNA